MPQGPVDLGFGTTEESFSAPRNRTHAAKQHAFEKCIALLDNKKGYPDGYPFLLARARDGDRILRLPRNTGKRRLLDCPKSFFPTFPQVYR